MKTRILWVITLAAIAASAADAQQNTAPRFDDARVSTTAMALAGSGLALAGLLGGAVVGSAIQPADDTPCEGTCPRVVPLALAFAGSALGAAWGVHVVNHKRGAIGVVLRNAALTQAGFFAASYLARNTNRLSDAFVLLSIPAEVAMAIHTERATAAKRAVGAAAPHSQTFARP